MGLEVPDRRVICSRWKWERGPNGMPSLPVPVPFRALVLGMSDLISFGEYSQMELTAFSECFVFLEKLRTHRALDFFRLPVIISWLSLFLRVDFLLFIPKLLWMTFPGISQAIRGSFMQEGVFDRGPCWTPRTPCVLGNRVSVVPLYILTSIMKHAA